MIETVKKIVFIVAHLVDDPSAFEGKTNADLEKEMLAEMPVIPYSARVEKVTVLDCL